MSNRKQYGPFKVIRPDDDYDNKDNNKLQKGIIQKKIYQIPITDEAYVEFQLEDQLVNGVLQQCISANARKKGDIRKGYIGGMSTEDHFGRRITEDDITDDLLIGIIHLITEDLPIFWYRYDQIFTDENKKEGSHE